MGAAKLIDNLRRADSLDRSTAEPLPCPSFLRSRTVLGFLPHLLYWRDDLPQRSLFNGNDANCRYLSRAGDLYLTLLPLVFNF
jgi:hypothetical protein